MACTAEKPSVSTERALIPIKVGALLVPDAAPAHIAFRRGLFRDEGLDVRLEPIQAASAALPALDGGSLQFALLNYVTAIMATAEGDAKLLMVADSYQAADGTFVVMVKGGSSYKTMADLRGRKIGVASRRSIGSITVASALKTFNMAESDVDLVEFPLPDMPALLEAGTIDAAWMTQPYVLNAAQKTGARELQDMTKGGPMADFPIAGWGVTAAYAKENPHVVAAFRRAIGKAQQIAANDRRAVEEVLPTYTKIDAATAAVIPLGTFPTTLEEGRLQRVADTMLEHGYLTEPFKVSALLAAQTPSPSSAPLSKGQP
ncbi:MULTISPECIES: ABC transporter substrate-binding protein [unclassified Streptosporangium]|uniref:ABC transporter substrate-binding protein n=1 Tax=unclassified Streptosporangium TaxID=2632669 RepID=UPI002E2CDAA5|nr:MULTISPECIES: ABC transporter substrate-binding protein [unclassified Streptosporangium]